MPRIPEGFYQDPAEQLLAVLGEPYVEETLVRGSRSRSILVLTDRRFYQVGRFYEQRDRGRFARREGKRVIPMEDVTGAYYRERVDRRAVAVSFLLAAVALAELALGVARGDGVLVGSGCMGFAAGALGLVLCFAKQPIFFAVTHRGGSIASKLRWYSRGDAKLFQRALWAEVTRRDGSGAAAQAHSPGQESPGQPFAAEA